MLPAPEVAMTLADLGADVGKVERPGSGDDTRSWGPPGSRRRLDLLPRTQPRQEECRSRPQDPADLGLAQRLAARADVLVENFSVGLMDEMGLGFSQLQPEHPGLVCCSISGFGSHARAAQPADHRVRVFREAGVPAGPINRIDEAFEWAKGVGLEPTVGFADNDTQTVRSPIRFSDSEIGTRLPPPQLDEHGAEIRAWLEQI